MRSAEVKHIVIIGCGNLAWHLAKKFRDDNFRVSIYNHKKNADLKAFTTELRCQTHASLLKIDKDADVYFICVSDEYIAEVSAKIKTNNKQAFVLHCSGSKGLDVMKNNGGNKGVMYPLQTFTKTDVVNWRETPLLLEAETAKQGLRLDAFASALSAKRLKVKTQERRKFHLAAVLVNNFTNSLYAAAQDLIGKEHFKLYYPIIDQTLKKMKKMGPQEAQTGPAKRNDKSVLDSHKELLAKNKSLRKVYSALTKLIKDQSH